MSASVCLNVPSIEQDKGKLLGGNGSWTNYGGKTDAFVYTWVMDGLILQGSIPLVFEGYRWDESDGTTKLYGRPPDQTPPGFQVKEYLLHPDEVDKHFQLYVYSASRTWYVREDGIVAWDGWEYGRFMDDASGNQAVSKIYTVKSFEASPPPSPPPVSPLPPELQTMVDNVNLERAEAKAKDFRKVIAANKEEWEKVITYFSDLYAGKSETAPSLTTNAMRWACGRLQETEIAHRLGKRT